jgi:hypothetical protein
MRGHQYQVYMPGFPPFMKWGDPGMTITNPIVSVQTMMTSFVDSHFTAADGVPTIPDR